ncbi:MAG: UvrD-helicase domain-containing protein [bacterium]|nr:UvrD-helicase domain-containing protein [bacterium]
MMGLSNYLNPEQVKAVTKTDGYLLILAGAGSGKTRVLTYKVAWLIGELKVKPQEILAVTFTNKAAEEMRTRVEKLIGAIAKRVLISTFHSFCARVLRKYGDLLGYSRNFIIYDADDSKRLIKHILKENRMKLKLSPQCIAEKISKAKNNFILPEDYPTVDFQSPSIKEVYRLYQTALKSNNAMDFDDLLINVYKVIKKSKEAIERFSFKYILVDEYQDTNRVQYELLKLLSAKHGNLTVVGDEDQSIYGFRGADIGNILHFNRDFPDVSIIRLEKSYRSTQTILRAASQVVKNNTLRLGKELWTMNTTGEKISLFVAHDANEEAYEIVNTIKRYNRPLSDFVVLYRTNAQSRAIEEAFRRSNIPYTIVGSIRFYERKEIKDVLAYLRLIVNPNDLVSFERIINVPPRGIGPKTFEVLTQFAEHKVMPVYSALREVDSIEGIASSKKVVLHKFYNLIEKYKRKSNKPANLIKDILYDTGYLDMLKQEGTFEVESKLENIDELISGSSKYETLTDFLETVSLFTDIDEWDHTQPMVTLMTVHNAKGLEFPIVFITGLEECLFPHSSSFYDEVELEEERRLFYVGLTRAKEKVHLSYAQNRRFGLSFPSRFIKEIPIELIETSWVLLPVKERLQTVRGYRSYGY